MFSKNFAMKSGQVLLVAVIFVQLCSNPVLAGKGERGGEGEKYGQDMVGDNSDNYYTGTDEYGYSNDPDGTKGIDPRLYGQDFADKKNIYDMRDSMEASLTLWIDIADDWEQDMKSKYSKYRGRTSYGKKYDGDKYNDDNEDDDYKSYGKGSRSKRSYKKVTLPVRHYKNYRRFPLKKFPPLFATFPWLPIFYDKLTYQTFIFSMTGGIYVLPPLVNFFGRRIAVAQLIKWGYASLVGGGVPPPPGVNVAPLVQPGAPASAPAVGYNGNNGQYTNAVQLDASKPNSYNSVPIGPNYQKRY